MPSCTVIALVEIFAKGQDIRHKDGVPESQKETRRYLDLKTKKKLSLRKIFFSLRRLGLVDEPITRTFWTHGTCGTRSCLPY